MYETCVGGNGGDVLGWNFIVGINLVLNIITGDYSIFFPRVCELAPPLLPFFLGHECLFG